MMKISLIIGLAIAVFMGIAYYVTEPYEKSAEQVADATISEIYIAPTSLEDIKFIEGPKVVPVVYTNTIPLTDLDIKEKKEAFIAMMLPSILLVKREMKNTRDRVLKISEKSSHTKEEDEWLAELYKKYKADDIPMLLKRLEPHPTSIILAQAALESGWGTSNFFKNANNVFGVWSFDPDEDRVAASQKRGGQTIYVKKYNALYCSVDDYFITLSTGPYQSFRDARMYIKDPYTLVDYLGVYSELGDEYAQRLKTVIRANNLTKYDKYKLSSLL